MAHLEEIYIKKFRCFDDFRLKNIKKINLITGKNGIGKTALLVYLKTKYLTSIERKAYSHTIDEATINAILPFIEPFLEYQKNVHHGTLEIDIKNSYFLKKVFYTAATLFRLKDCEKRIFLIDDIEIGLHHSQFEPFLKMILDLSERFDIQVFFTSHSAELIETYLFFVENMGMATQTVGFRLYKSLENGKVTTTIYEDFPFFQELVECRARYRG